MHFPRVLVPPATLALCNSVEAKNTYEYIVVGSGPGGGPLAANLARHGHSNNTLAINDPLTRWDFFVSRDLPEIEDQFEFTTWRLTDGEFYVSLDPPADAERLGIYYPRAGVVGGCAIHNAATISLPPDVDWQDIAEITGDDSWSVENMRQYLVRLERCNYLANGSTSDHGFNGYLDTSQADPSRESGLSLFELLGRDVNSADPNRDNILGLFTPHTHSRNGVRSSPANYLRATLDDPRGYPLTVQENTLVTKVLFSNTTSGGKGKEPRAIGLEYLRGKSLYSADPRHGRNSRGTPGKAFATKEVILARGVFNTPQILKLSGVGPVDELRKLKIPVVRHLPGIGTGLSDNYEAVLYGTFERPFLNNLTDNVFTENRPCAPGVECTDDWQRRYLRAQTYSHHAVGACAIGSDDNALAVLDSKFRVRGIKSLRVVDGSAFPVQPGKVPSLATFMSAKRLYMIFWQMLESIFGVVV
ncbi:hypothetical protein EDB81DRAFT_766576 [Dactylonectria macrodidyma]|uniref:Glucose-methanol-choline oxidoreductase N-terminal domain-containing protein n=1 Tax=Dactylonectria macrodidyma TaxID=307937 RepID=A0A9P9DJU0_9HYPO|nr:hypothetical protein EDB81DRAFT_766576 [Dactylonectria macrodidyma]